MSVALQVAVIGGGITGLACAFRLQQIGIHFSLFEASERVGGLISTVEEDGFLFEAGPQCPRFPRPVWELVRHLGLEEEFVRADPGAPRYILKNARLHRAPFSPLGLLSTRLIGFASKYRILSEPFHRSQFPGVEESLADFIRRKFGADALDYLVDPFIGSIFAGDTEKLGLESAFPALFRWEQDHGSLLRGAIRSRKASSHSQPSRDSSADRANVHRPRWHVARSLPSLGSFRGGLGTLPKKLVEKLQGSIHLRARAESLEHDLSCDSPLPRWRLRFREGEEVRAAAVVIAVPAYEAARLLERAAPKLSSMLTEISYAPLAVVACGYDRAQMRQPPRGFGLLIPRREKLQTLCTVWNSSLFADRAPADKILMTSFAGGATNPALVEMPAEAIARVVENETGLILGIDGPPEKRMAWRYPKALPQFNLGHAQRVVAIRETLERLPGLYLAGNYLHGRSIGDCVEIAFRTAEEVRTKLPG